MTPYSLAILPRSQKVCLSSSSMGYARPSLLLPALEGPHASLSHGTDTMYLVQPADSSDYGPNSPDIHIMLDRFGHATKTWACVWTTQASRFRHLECIFCPFPTLESKATMQEAIVEYDERGAFLLRCCHMPILELPGPGSPVSYLPLCQSGLNKQKALQCLLFWKRPKDSQQPMRSKLSPFTPRPGPYIWSRASAIGQSAALPMRHLWLQSLPGGPKELLSFYKRLLLFRALNARAHKMFWTGARLLGKLPECCMCKSWKPVWLPPCVHLNPFSLHSLQQPKNCL